MTIQEAIDALQDLYLTKETMALAWRTLEEQGFETDAAYMYVGRLYIPISERGREEWLLFSYHARHDTCSFFRATHDMLPQRYSSIFTGHIASVTGLLYAISRALFLHNWYTELKVRT